MELLKLLSTNEIIAQIVGFLLLVFLLRIFAWNKFLGLLDARRERIASDLKRIEEAQAEAAKLKTDYEKKLTSIEEAARAKVQETIAHGKQIAEEIRKKAQQDSRAILEKAQENIELELAKAKEELKERIVELTIDATEKIIKDKLTDTKDRQLVTDFLEELEKTK